MAKKKQQHLISDTTPENNENRKLNFNHFKLMLTFQHTIDSINNAHSLSLSLCIRICMHVIDYRNHTIRMKRWLPEIEQQIFYALNMAKTENEAVQFLLNLGLTSHEIDLILQNFLTNTELNIRKREEYKKLDNYQERTPLSVQEQQLELIGFSQGVNDCNLTLFSFIPFHPLFVP